MSIKLTTILLKSKTNYLGLYKKALHKGFVALDQQSCKYATGDTENKQENDKMIINDDKKGIENLVKQTATSKHVHENKKSNDESKIRAFDGFTKAVDQNTSGDTILNQLKEELKGTVSDKINLVGKKVANIVSSNKSENADVSTGEQAIDSVAEDLSNKLKKPSSSSQVKKDNKIKNECD